MQNSSSLFCHANKYLFILIPPGAQGPGRDLHRDSVLRRRAVRRVDGEGSILGRGGAAALPPGVGGAAPPQASRGLPPVRLVPPPSSLRGDRNAHEGTSYYFDEGSGPQLFPAPNLIFVSPSAFQLFLKVVCASADRCTIALLLSIFGRAEFPLSVRCPSVVLEEKH